LQYYNALLCFPEEDLLLAAVLPGSQEGDGQHRDPEHGTKGADARLNPDPRRRQVCRDPGPSKPARAPNTMPNSGLDFFLSL